MSSFYGGKQGRTYHIVARYDSVHQMVSQFQKGGSYIEANYGQYVLIDTVLRGGNRSNRQNGLLFRRGFDYLETQKAMPNQASEEFITDGHFDQSKYQIAWQNWVKAPGGGAIYIGQIVGPEGRTQQIDILNWSDFLQQAENNPSGSSSIVLEQSTTGKQDDDIKFGYVNIIDENGDIQAGYISIDIPKLVTEAQVVEHSPYSTAGVKESPSSTAHPLYYKWDFTVPDGKHGQNFEKIVVEDGSATEATVDGEGNNIVNNDKYFTYSYVNFDQSAAGSTTAHLGRWPYRVIDYIEASTVNRPVLNYAPETAYSLGDIINIASPIYAICTRAGQTGENSNIFNNAEVGMQIDQVLTDSTATPAKWSVISLTSTPAATSLRVDYKAGEDDYIPFKQIDHFFSDSETGDLYVVYSTDLSTPVFLTNIKQIKSISVDGDIRNNQDIVAEYKNGNVETVGTSNQILDIQRFGDTIRVLYSDPRVRNQIPEGHTATLGANETWVDWRTGTTYTAADGLKWYNFGDLGSQFHVQGTLSFDDLKIPATPGSTTAVPWGLGDAETGTENRQGWIVSIPDVKVIEGEGQQPSSTVEVQRLFAYNYAKATPENSTVGYHTIQANNGTTYSSNWYEIMSFSDALTPPEGHIVVSQDIDSPSPGSIYQTREQLVQKGVWLVVTGGTCNAS